MGRIVNIILWVLTAIVSAVTVAAAYAGHINPIHHPFAAVMVMLTPLMVPVLIGVFALDLLLRRRALILAAVAVVAVLPAALDTFPVNFGHSAPENLRLAPDDTSAFTLLTYNVVNFQDLTGKYPGDINPTLSYILRTDADIVCLQEAEALESIPQYHLRQPQIDSLTARYPYIIVNTNRVMLLSRFPAEPLPVNFTLENGDASSMLASGYTLDIHGRRVALFSVHLQSYGLTDDDKDLYGRVTRGKVSKGAPRDSVRTELIYKIERAAIARARQTDVLVRAIKQYGGDNVIVAGDFNDVPGCWALTRLSDIGLSEVYPRVGLGYMRTYNRNRFYFRIDHVLTSKNIRPLWMHRDVPDASDHYPLLTALEFDN